MTDYENFPANDMTSRDEFVKAAMAAILSNPALTNESNFRDRENSDQVAMNAMRYADAALQKLEDFK